MGCGDDDILRNKRARASLRIAVPGDIDLPDGTPSAASFFDGSSVILTKNAGLKVCCRDLVDHQQKSDPDEPYSIGVPHHGLRQQPVWRMVCGRIIHVRRCLARQLLQRNGIWNMLVGPLRKMLQWLNLLRQNMPICFREREPV